MTAEPGTAGEAGHSIRLSDAHLAELAGSCITDEVIAQRGYRTLEDTPENRGLLKDLRIPEWAWKLDDAWPGMLIPLYRATGEVISHQFKPAVPQLGPGGKPMKYVSPRGDTNHIDVPPAVCDHLRNTSEPLWMTEGVKKADSLVSHGKAAIALTGVWNWRGKDGTLGDWEDIPLAGRTVVVCYDADTVQKRSVMLAMRRLGRWLESKKVGSVRYLIVPPVVEQPDGEAVAVKGVDDYFHAGGRLQDLDGHALRELPIDGPKDAAFSDSYLTDTLVEEALEGRFVWAPGLGWMAWDGRRWAECTDAEILEATRLWAIDQFQNVLDEQRKDPNREMGNVLDGWRALLAASRQRTLVQMARGPLLKPAADFDAHPDLLNCPNGVVDLRTGELMSSDPDLYLTKMAGVPYRTGAQHPDWTKALEALADDVRDWYQIRIGQAFTGYMTPDDSLILQQGGGENGKSTINVPLSEAAGSYYVLVSHRVLMASPDAHPTELMDFRGVRYAVMEETPEERRLEPQRLKTIVGTPKITARHIRQDSVTFKATHSLFINTNYMPIVNETDHGTWRRLARLTYPYTYRKTAEEVVRDTDRLGDPTVRLRCENDPKVWEAALAWAVEGAVAWYRLDKAMPAQPERVRRDTWAWRTESDMLLAWVGERVTFDRGAYVRSSDLLNDFNDWMSQSQGGVKPWSAKLFASRFGGHSEASLNRVENVVQRIDGKTARVWTGLRLRQDDDPFYADVVNSPNDVRDNPENKIVTVVTGTSVNSETAYTRELNPSSCNNRNAQVSESADSAADLRDGPKTAPESPPEPLAAANGHKPSADPFQGTFDRPVYTVPPARKERRPSTDPDAAAEFLGTADVPAGPSPLAQWNDAVEGFFAGVDPDAPAQTEPTNDQPTDPTDDESFWADPWGDD